MTSAQLKRNILAIVIAIPVIYGLSLLTSLFDSDFRSGPFSWNLNSPSFGTGLLSSDKSLTRVANLKGKWRFMQGDNSAWAAADFDDSGWDNIKVPAYWEGQGYKNYDGFGWYRRSFDVNEKNLENDLYVVMGHIDDVDEVFINGQRIGGRGEFPPTYVGAWDQHRKYVIPNEIIKQRDNVIAVRVYDAQMAGGIYKGDVGIYVSNLPKLLVNLEGEWEFRTDRDENYSIIRVPGTWEDQGHPHYDGMAYYKRTFGAIDVEEGEQLILLLGKVDDTDEVTLNGELIGRIGTLKDSDQEVDSDYFRIDRRYPFSASLLKENNLIEVRVHDSTGLGGIYEGPVGVMTKKAFEKHKEQFGKT